MTTNTSRVDDTTTSTSTNEKDLQYLTGVSMYAKVHEPQKSKTYPEARPRFSISVVMKDDDAQLVAFRKLLKTSRVTKTVPKKLTDENGTETGQTQVSIGRTAYHNSDGALENPLRKIVDAKGKDIPPTTLIGNGSKVKVAYRIKSNPNGNYLVLEGIQVLELIPYVRTEMFTVEDEHTVTITAKKPSKKGDFSPRG